MVQNLPHRRFPNTVTGSASRVGVHIQYLLYRFGFTRRRFTKYCFYCSRNVLESKSPIQEGCYRDFVGSIEGNSFCPSRFDCLIGQT